MDKTLVVMLIIYILVFIALFTTSYLNAFNALADTKTTTNLYKLYY